MKLAVWDGLLFICSCYFVEKRVSWLGLVRLHVVMACVIPPARPLSTLDSTSRS